MELFYTTTLVSGYIKYLLMNTPLPNCSFAYPGMYIVEGNKYLYKNNIIECVSSGIFHDESLPIPMAPLTSSEKVICRDEEGFTVTDREVPFGGSLPASTTKGMTYREGDSVIGLTENFVSSVTSYDWKTHRALGDYLRMLKSMYSLDLMPLYNCHCDVWVDDVNISGNKLSGTESVRYKTTLVPIKFNIPYTVSLNSVLPVYTKPVIYKDGLVKDIDGKYVYDRYFPEISMHRTVSRSNPITVEAFNTIPHLQKYEKNLYLAISMPKSVQTDIVVIEGNASPSNVVREYDISAITRYSDVCANNLFKSGCSLLRDNEPLVLTDNRPFSHKLIGYLIKHTIDSRDVMVENVMRIGDKVNAGKENYFWTPELRSLIYHKYMKACDKYPDLDNMDILGYVDGAVEKAMERGRM